MIPNNTVLVLGAGASRPYLFPTARELTDLILERNENPDLLRNMGFNADAFQVGNNHWTRNPENLFLQYRHWLEELLQVHRLDKDELEEFQKRFLSSQAYSVDLFVADNPGYKKVASLMIACIILRCEQEERLYGDWYQFLFNELIDEGRDFHPNTLSIITFNYDRSLEMYFHRAFLNRYNLKSSEAWQIVRRIEIIHVYGDLGPLFNEQGGRELGYGSIGAVQEASEHIQLVDPRIHSELASEIQKLLGEAAKIIFLGFGFDKLNLEAVEITKRDAVVFASSYGLSVPAMARAERRLRPSNAVVLPSANGQWIRWGDKNDKVTDFLHNSLALA